MVAKHKSPSSDFSSAGGPAPKPMIMTGPAYVRLGKKLVDVDEDGTIRYARPYLETLKVSAEPCGRGLYLIHKHRQIDFQDEGIIHLKPAVSEYQVNTDLRYTQTQAAAEMVRLMNSWKREGFALDNVTPDETPVNLHQKPAPG